MKAAVTLTVQESVNVASVVVTTFAGETIAGQLVCLFSFLLIIDMF
jgi:hypothetical protein